MSSISSNEQAVTEHACLPTTLEKQVKQLVYCFLFRKTDTFMSFLINPSVLLHTISILYL